MRNILVTLKYDGKPYHGWQVQNNAVTVQETFQNGLEWILGERPDIKGCSRTDAGVHANQYCLNFRTQHRIPCERLVPALNSRLPKSIAVLKAEEVPEEFHARYSCRGKEYLYRIWNDAIRDPFLDGYALHYWYPLHLDRMNEAGRYLLGRHDFTSFCTVDSRREKGDFHRTVTALEVVREGAMVTVRIQADGFLYNMVRIIVGTLLAVSQGKLEPSEMPQILAALDRTRAGVTVPPDGLYLNKVIYAMRNEEWVGRI